MLKGIKLTNSMGRSRFWENISYLLSKQIRHCLYEAHYLVHTKSPYTVPFWCAFYTTLMENRTHKLRLIAVLRHGFKNL